MCKSIGSFFSPKGGDAYDLTHVMAEGDDNQ